MTPTPQLVVRACAKINIGWLVGDRRPDGYHEVTGLIQTIDLADELEVSPEATDGFEVGGVPLRLVAEGRDVTEDDLVIRAARVLAERAPARPTTIRLRKHIPVAAGLGGGSADAAGALVGLNLAWKAGLPAGELTRLAAEVGSDVPALLVGGLLRVFGRGERVHRIGSADRGAFVLGVSDEGLSTAEVYAALEDHRAATGDAIHHNDLEAPAVALRPGLAEQLAAMRGAAGVGFLAGSGPTVVGACATHADAEEVASGVREVFDRVLVVAPSTWGVRVSVGPPAPS